MQQVGKLSFAMALLTWAAVVMLAAGSFCAQLVQAGSFQGRANAESTAAKRACSVSVQAAP